MLGKKPTKEERHEQDLQEWHHMQKNWRAWGSWFSWGSPVGLGLFFLSLAVCAWIIAQI